MLCGSYFSCQMKYGPLKTSDIPGAAIPSNWASMKSKVCSGDICEINGAK